MSETSTTWPTLTLVEARILGVLVEKQKTTPDVYPMTLNGLVTGCNQKSNRDPVMNLTGDDIEETLVELQKKALATRVDSGRAEKFRHLLYEAWAVSKIEIAILAELLLRGPQTEGELRTRVSRMEPVPDLDALRLAIQPLKIRKLVVYLTPENRRGTVLTHGFHPTEELPRLRARFSGAADADDAPRFTTSSATSRVDQLAAEIAELRQIVQTLASRIDSLENPSPQA